MNNQIKSRAVHRLKLIEGQMRGLQKMVEEDTYCIDIITQIQAARAALQTISKTILAKHLKHCVAAALKEDEEAEIDRKLEEIMVVIKRMEK